MCPEGVDDLVIEYTENLDCNEAVAVLEQSGGVCDAEGDVGGLENWSCRMWDDQSAKPCVTWYESGYLSGSSFITTEVSDPHPEDACETMAF